MSVEKLNPNTSACETPRIDFLCHFKTGGYYACRSGVYASFQKVTRKARHVAYKPLLRLLAVSRAVD